MIWAGSFSDGTSSLELSGEEGASGVLEELIGRIV